jgi:putative molybdopterin biosynthesis protein
MKNLMSTKEVSRYLGVNEKMVYVLVAEKGLPASKVTGKWIFPQHLVDQWIEANTQNLPTMGRACICTQGLLIITGSNDPLLEQTISLFNATYPESLAVFGNLGSMGGIRALKQGLCQIATSHLLQSEGDDYNFEFIGNGFAPPPVVVNFCRRLQGLILARGNPKKIRATQDLGQPELRLVNRKLGTGTRLLFDRELKAAGIDGNRLRGYDREVSRHMDVGLAVLAGEADAGPGIQPVAARLGLDFVPWRWERYDLLVLKDRFFDPVVQQFLGLLREKQFQNLAQHWEGYDLAPSGRIIFQLTSPKDGSS